MAGCGYPVSQADDSRLERSVVLAAAYRALDADPRNDFAYLHLANALIECGHRDEAREVYRRMRQSGCQFLGFYDDPRFHLALMEIEEGHHERARELLEELRGERRDEFGLLLYLAAVLHHEQRYDDAIEVYDRFLEKSGEGGQAYRHLRKSAARHEPLSGFCWAWPPAQNKAST